MLGDNDLPDIPNDPINRDILDTLHTLRRKPNVCEQAADARHQRMANSRRLIDWQGRRWCASARNDTPPLRLQRYRRRPVSLDATMVVLTCVVMLVSAAWIVLV